MADVTAEMKLAMGVLAGQGVEHYATSGHKLDCGCRALVGWDTRRFVPFAGIEPCAEHREQASRAATRFEAMEPSDRLASELLAELLEEEIGACT